MSIQEIESAYDTLYKAVEEEQVQAKNSFYEAYVSVVEGMLATEIPVAKEAALYPYFVKLQKLTLSPEERRKVSQLVLLKGLQVEALQANHQLTPDSIAYIFAYLIERMQKQKKLKIYDPANGMGNLLASIVLQLKASGRSIEAFASEIDDVLLEIAAVNADWFEMPLQLFHQDGVQKNIRAMDVVVCDLPIGYYPLDEAIMTHKTRAKEGHTYAHHLLMEAGVAALSDSGVALFLAPTSLLASPQAEELKAWLQEDAYLQAIFHLPTSLFKNEASQKSIFILQKRSAQTAQAEVLVAQLPNFTNGQGMQKFFQRFTQWNEMRG